jgi:hypothetical protein
LEHEKNNFRRRFDHRNAVIAVEQSRLNAKLQVSALPGKIKTKYAHFLMFS